jgi:hypothetical protein
MNPEKTEKEITVELQPEKVEKSHAQIIIDNIFADGRSVFTEKEAKEKVMQLIELLTAKQRFEVAKKAERCKIVRDKMKMNVKPSIIKNYLQRKYSLDRLTAHNICNLCTSNDIQK